jgi:hypothetical protein
MPAFMRLTEIRSVAQLQRTGANRTCEAGQGGLASSIAVNGLSAMHTVDGTGNATLAPAVSIQSGAPNFQI